MRFVFSKDASIIRSVFFCLLLNLFLNLSGTRAACGPKEIYECIRPINDKYDVDLTKQNIFRMGMIFKLELVQRFCLDLEELGDCLKSQHSSEVCDDRSIMMNRNANTFLKASYFLCDQTTRRRNIDYKVIFSCFDKQSVKYYIDRCHQEMMDDLRNISRFFSRFELSNSLNQLPIIIGLYNEKLGVMEDCLYHLLKEACGPEVANWFRDYMLLMVEPLWNYFSSRYYVKYVYSYLMLSLAIVCSFIIYLFFKSYKSHLEEKLNYARDANINVPDNVRLIKTKGIRQQLAQALSQTGPKQSPSDITLATMATMDNPEEPPYYFAAD